MNTERIHWRIVRAERKHQQAIDLINSDPELQTLFHQAMTEQWSREEFQQRVRETSWYQRRLAAYVATGDASLIRPPP